MSVNNSLSLVGLNKAAVLAALYNMVRPQGRGLDRYDPKPITVEEAQKIIDRRGLSFDYLEGRVMKIDLSGDTVDVWLYDRDNGDGAASRLGDQAAGSRRARRNCRRS